MRYLSYKKWEELPGHKAIMPSGPKPPELAGSSSSFLIPGKLIHFGIIMFVLFCFSSYFFIIFLLSTNFYRSWIVYGHGQVVSFNILFSPV